MGGELGYRYDSHQRLTRLINENKAEYKFAYDPLDRLIHDPVGNVTQKLENETASTERVTQYLRDKTTISNNKNY